MSRARVGVRNNRSTLYARHPSRTNYTLDARYRARRSPLIEEKPGAREDYRRRRAPRDARAAAKVADIIRSRGVGRLVRTGVEKNRRLLYATARRVRADATPLLLRAVSSHRPVAPGVRRRPCDFFRVHIALGRRAPTSLQLSCERGRGPAMARFCTFNGRSFETRRDGGETRARGSTKRARPE